MEVVKNKVLIKFFEKSTKKICRFHKCAYICSVVVIYNTNKVEN